MRWLKSIAIQVAGYSNLDIAIGWVFAKIVRLIFPVVRSEPKIKNGSIVFIRLEGGIGDQIMMMPTVCVLSANNCVIKFLGDQRFLPYFIDAFGIEISEGINPTAKAYFFFQSPTIGNWWAFFVFHLRGISPGASGLWRGWGPTDVPRVTTYLNSAGFSFRDWRGYKSKGFSLMSDEKMVEIPQEEFYLVSLEKTDFWVNGRLRPSVAIDWLATLGLDAQTLIFVGTDAMESGRYIDALRRDVRTKYKVVNLVGQTSFRQLVGLIKQSNGVVCVDGGVSHLGCFLRKKVFTYFTFANPHLYWWIDQHYQYRIEPGLCDPCIPKTNLPIRNYPARCINDSLCGKICAKKVY